jgi:diamine N-acetyltransferase
MTTVYRVPEAADAAALATLARDSFVETFAHLYAPEDLNAFLDTSRRPEVILEGLANPMSRYLVVEDAGKMVGYCKMGLNPVFEDYDPEGRRVVELKELYILAMHQGTGIAQKLMDWALEVAREHKADEVVLSVWSGNAKGQRFYQKHGFSWLADTYFMVGNQRDEEFLFMRPMSGALA